MHNAIHVTRTFARSTTPSLNYVSSLFVPGSVYLFNSQCTINLIPSFIVHCCSKIYFTMHWCIYCLTCSARTVLCGLWPDSQQIICLTKCQHFLGISRKTVFATCKFTAIYQSVTIAFSLKRYRSKSAYWRNEKNLR